MVDLTDVRGLFGILTFKVGAVFDVFSRMPLSARVFSKEPSAVEIAQFVSRTAHRHGRPGEGSGKSPFRIEYLDSEQRLPVLFRNAT